MERLESEIHLDERWRAALFEASRRRRVVVLGATDMGKSTFIRAALAEAGDKARLIDLDPGQKMIGPPGTASLGHLGSGGVERFIFLGTTSASSFGAIVRAASELARAAARQGAFIVNTSGFVKGLGARLQAATIAALEPDMIVQIGHPGEPPIVPGSRDCPFIRLDRSPAATRKSAAARTRLRQAAFEQAFSGAELRKLPRSIAVEPGPPVPFASPARPVCSLAGDDGVDIGYGILAEVEEDGWLILSVGATEAISRLRLGRMWAGPKEGVWRLAETLEPAWTAEPA